MTLTKRHQKLAQEYYQGKWTEEELLKRHRLSDKQFQKCLEAEDFQQELDRLCTRSMQETRLIISRFGPIAAMRLAELLGSDKDDTARRTALDVVDRCLRNFSAKELAEDLDSETDELSDDQAKNMVLALAEAIKDA
jgi:hypothetical protein